MTTRSRWKFRICTTTNDLTLYGFSSLYIFVTSGWPTVAETCRQPNKTDTKTVVFWRTYPLLIRNLVFAVPSIFFFVWPVCNVGCDDFFVMSFIIFILFKFRTKLLVANHLIIWKRTKFDTEQKSFEISAWNYDTSNISNSAAIHSQCNLTELSKMRHYFVCFELFFFLS